MIRRTRLAAALAFGTGLAMAGAASAQSGSTPAATPSTPSTTSSSSGSNASQPVYTVAPPPPDASPDLNLPAVAGSLTRSTAGCVLAGCDSGPEVGGPGLSTPGSDHSTPPSPGNLPPPIPH